MNKCHLHFWVNLLGGRATCTETERKIEVEILRDCCRHKEYQSCKRSELKWYELVDLKYILPYLKYVLLKEQRGRRLNWWAGTKSNTLRTG